MECLNTFFTVVHYNGGAMKGLTGIQKLFGDIYGKPATPHSTRSGQLFDVVLKYDNPNADSPCDNVFTLNYLIATCLGSEVATAPLKTAIFFVSDTPDIEYSDKFDKITVENFEQSGLSPRPSGFLQSVQEQDLVSAALTSNSTGKYLHIKMTSSWGDDNNIDLGMFKILGQHGKAGSAVKVDQYQGTVTDTEMEMLCERRFMKRVPKVGDVSMLHGDFSDSVHTDHTLLFVSTLNIAESVAAVEQGAASDDQKAVVQALHQLQVASKDVHHMMLRFYAMDVTTSKRLAEMLLAFLGECEVTETPVPVSTCETGPYDLPLGVPIKIVKDDDEDTDNMSDDVVASTDIPQGSFSLKSRKPFMLAAISNANMSMKYVFDEQDMSAVLHRVEHTGGAHKDYILSGSDPVGLFVRCFNVVANELSKLAVEQSFGEHGAETEDLEVLQTMKKMGLYDKKKHGVINNTSSGFDHSKSALLGLLSPRCLSSSTLTNAMHPVYTNLVLLTHDNFQQVVVNDAKAIVFSVVDMSMPSSVVMTQKLLEFSEVVQKFKLDLRVGVFDSASNDFPLEHFDEEMYECIFMYTKTAKAGKAVKGKFPTPQSFCVDASGKPVYRYQLLFSELVGDEDREMMDELAAELGEEQTLPTPSIADVLSFVASHNPKCITPKVGSVEAKRLQTLCKSLNELVDMWSYCENVSSTILPSLGERMRVKHSGKQLVLERTSVASGYVERLKNLSKEVHVLSQQLVMPFGKNKLMLNGEDRRVDQAVAALPLNSVEAKVRSIHAGLEQCVEGITPVLQSVMLCRSAVEGTALLMQQFPKLWADAVHQFAAQFKGFGACFAKVVHNVGMHTKIGAIPAVIADALVAINESVSISLEPEVIHFFPSEMGLCGEQLEKCRETMEQVILKHTMKEDEAIFGQDIPLLHSDDHLERYLQGYEMLDIPKKPTPQSKRKVADASDRLVCILIMSLKDDTLSQRQIIADCMREISARYKAEKEEDETMKNVVFARVRVEDYPEVQEQLNVSAFPCLVFTQNMGEADDLRSTGAPASEIPRLLRDSIESMQLLDNADDYDLMGDDDEYDD